jgi:hypothetical protein
MSEVCECNSLPTYIWDGEFRCQSCNQEYDRRGYDRKILWIKDREIEQLRAELANTVKRYRPPPARHGGQQAAAGTMAFLESECERLHAELAAAYDFQKEEYNRTEDVIVGLEDQLAALREQEPLPDIKTIGKAKLKVKSVSRLEPPKPTIPEEWVQAIVESVAEFVEIQQGGLNSPAVIGAAIRGKNTYSSYFYEALLAAQQEKNND